MARTRRLTIDDATPERIRCTAKQHQWDEIPDDGQRHRAYKNTNSVERVVSRCPHCKNKKYEVWSKLTGDVIVDPAYVYSPGYNLPGANLKKKHFRKAYLTQLRKAPK